jgi:hypothetical protein
LHCRSWQTGLVPSNDFAGQQRRANGGQEDPGDSGPSRAPTEAGRHQQDAKNEEEKAPKLLDQEDGPFACMGFHDAFPSMKSELRPTAYPGRERSVAHDAPMIPASGAYSVPVAMHDRKHELGRIYSVIARLNGSMVRAFVDWQLKYGRAALVGTRAGASAHPRRGLMQVLLSLKRRPS